MILYSATCIGQIENINSNKIRLVHNFFLLLSIRSPSGEEKFVEEFFSTDEMVYKPN